MSLQLNIPPIENPVISPKEGTIGGVTGNPLGFYIARLWQTTIIVGGMALLVFLIWGAIDWLMSEGNQEKLTAAKNKIFHALMGLGILAASFAIVKVIELIFGFDILKISWPTP